MILRWRASQLKNRERDILKKILRLKQCLINYHKWNSSVPSGISQQITSTLIISLTDSFYTIEQFALHKEYYTCAHWIHCLDSKDRVFYMDVGHTDKVQHSIKLHDETPFKHKARPIHPNDLEAVCRHLEELFEAGIIRESESSFSSPIVVRRKKNGDIRLCIDYRKLNMQTIKDAYALPNLEETFSTLRDSKWFSVLNLKSGYYQIELEEKDKLKTTFVSPLGFWEFNRMPPGITNAPSTFQMLMEKCMGNINLSEVFLDDLIVFSDTLEEHERCLHVLGRLKDYGLKLSLDKCKFFQTSVKYLGHIFSKDGVETDPQKIEAIKT